jgi:hypothetical protein
VSIHDVTKFDVTKPSGKAEFRLELSGPILCPPLLVEPTPNAHFTYAKRLHSFGFLFLSLSLPMKFTSVILGLLSTRLVVNGLPADWDEQLELAQVITSCVVPDTVVSTAFVEIVGMGRVTPPWSAGTKLRLI